MVTCYTYTEATQDFKIFTCCTRQYVHKYNYLNNGLRQPAYNYSNYSSTTTSYSTTTRHPVARALHQLCRAPRLLVTRSHELYLNPAMRRDYSSPGCNDSMSTLPCTVTTSAMPRVQVPQHDARLITRLVAPLVVEYFAYDMRPGVSARRAACHAACHVARRAACRRLLRLHRASGCLGTPRGSSRGLSCRSSSTSSLTSCIRVPRHVAR
jgi:hypothetical protein